MSSTTLSWADRARSGAGSAPGTTKLSPVDHHPPPGKQSTRSATQSTTTPTSTSPSTTPTTPLSCQPAVVDTEASLPPPVIMSSHPVGGSLTDITSSSEPPSVVSSSQHAGSDRSEPACPSADGHPNIWKIRTAELSKRYPVANTTATALTTHTTHSPAVPVPVASSSPSMISPILRPIEISASGLDLLNDTTLWPAPSEELANKSHPNHHGSQQPKKSPEHEDASAQPPHAEAPAKKSGGAKKIQWKAIQADITHNAPLPTKYPASARGQRQQSRKDHSSGSARPQGSRSHKSSSAHPSPSSAPRSSSRRTSSAAANPAQSHSVPEDLPVLPDIHRAPVARPLDQDRPSQSTLDQAPHRLGYGHGPYTHRHLGHLNGFQPPVDRSSGDMLSGSLLALDISSDSPSLLPHPAPPVIPPIANAKPGFIPRIPATIQPPAMELSAGPAPRPYLSLSTPFRMPDSARLPSSTTLPLCGIPHLARDHGESNCDSVNKVVPDLHVNAPQGNVWVNDPLVMSDGSTPVVLNSMNGALSAAMVLDGSSIDRHSPLDTPNLALRPSGVDHSQSIESNTNSVQGLSYRILEGERLGEGSIENSENRESCHFTKSQNHETSMNSEMRALKHPTAYSVASNRLPRKPREADSGHHVRSLSIKSAQAHDSPPGFNATNGTTQDLARTGLPRENHGRRIVNTGPNPRAMGRTSANGSGPRGSGRSNANWRASNGTSRTRNGMTPERARSRAGEDWMTSYLPQPYGMTTEHRLPYAPAYAEPSANELGAEYYVPYEPTQYAPYDYYPPPITPTYYYPSHPSGYHYEEPDQLSAYVLSQCEYYFSVENLVKDLFLRSQMDEEGWVKIEVIGTFNRIKTMLKDTDRLGEMIEKSWVLEVDRARGVVRKREGWAEWLPSKQTTDGVKSG